jgi:hypothetical protein
MKQVPCVTLLGLEGASMGKLRLEDSLEGKSLLGLRG